jgi:hypothetical protein
MNILDQIRKEEIEKYGALCPNPECNVYKKFCRCHLSKIEDMSKITARHTNELRWVRRENGKATTLVLQQKVVKTIVKALDVRMNVEWVDIPVTEETNE